jgi:hypothetical protein
VLCRAIHLMFLSPTSGLPLLPLPITGPTMVDALAQPVENIIQLSFLLRPFVTFRPEKPLLTGEIPVCHL